jgi:KipI family sensor histidine kinase inhibitor
MRPQVIESLGDAALLVRLGDVIDEATHRRVRAAHAALVAAKLPGVGDIVPAYTTLAIHFDPVSIDYEALERRLTEVLGAASEETSPASRLVRIPVWYGGDDGPDLAAVAAHAQLGEDEVVRLHVAGEYVVHMIGFAPGFPYLAGLDPRLACPRRESPRARVPAGSVGIGGSQTGVYPIEIAGGWQLIGRTSLVLFDADGEPPTLLAPGDRVQFVEARP